MAMKYGQAGRLVTRPEKGGKSIEVLCSRFAGYPAINALYPAPYRAAEYACGSAPELPVAATSAVPEAKESSDHPRIPPTALLLCCYFVQLHHRRKVSASAIASTRISSGNHGIASAPSNVLARGYAAGRCSYFARSQPLSVLLGMTHAHQGEPPWRLKTLFAPRKSTAGRVCGVREEVASEREEACVSLPSRPPSRLPCAAVGSGYRSQYSIAGQYLRSEADTARNDAGAVRRGRVDLVALVLCAGLSFLLGGALRDEEGVSGDTFSCGRGSVTEGRTGYVSWCISPSRGWFSVLKPRRQDFCRSEIIGLFVRGAVAW
ncbi:hypothetical protein K438DRAFT_1943722 [Mycena galopus ATCC 62051]|nr:hypothetical protein K438DRAFT_1943722 [Mycena galopus ATCC 62051]